MPGPGKMPGPRLVFLLLLLLPTPVLSTRSTLFDYLTQDQSHNPGSWLQESPTNKGESCRSPYNVYSILDMSGSVKNWLFIYSFVQKLVNKFENLCRSWPQADLLLYLPAFPCFFQLCVARCFPR